MVYLSRIYTKSGDAGQTGLGDGQRVDKDSPRVQAYGEVDELNAILGMVVHVSPSSERELLVSIQNELFDLGADLCVPIAPNEGKCLRILPLQVERLEREIDRVNADLSPLTSFVLPGGTLSATWYHLARTVCRRAERSLVTLMKTEQINLQALIYLNRLSDLFFVLARAANDSGKADVLWQPGKTRGTSPLA